jgi:hypothetical protein
VGGRCTPIHTGGETGGSGGVVVGTTGGTNNPTGGSTGGTLPPRGTGDGPKGSGGTTTGTGGTTVGGNNPPSGPDNNLCLKCGDCCVLRHPSSPVGATGSTGKTGTGGIADTGGPSKGTGGNTPIHRIPTGVFTPSQPPSSSKPSYVIGRGGGGLNVFKASGPTGGSSGGKTTNLGNISSLRSTPAPILHAMPSTGGGGGMGGGSKGPMIR